MNSVRVGPRSLLPVLGALLVLFSGCTSFNDDSSNKDGVESPPNGPPSLLDRKYPNNFHWEANETDSSSYVSFSVHVEKQTDWRVIRRIDSYNDNTSIFWASSLLIEDHDGFVPHVVNVSTPGHTNSFPVCEAPKPGPVELWCERDSFREDLRGAFIGGISPGTYVFYAARYGGSDTRLIEVEVGSNEAIDVLDIEVGRSDLLLLDFGGEGVDDQGNVTHANATLDYHAEAPILGDFRGIRSRFDEFSALHESGLEFHFERTPHTGEGDWVRNGEPASFRMFSGPAGHWVFKAKGERAPDGPSSPVLGILIDPFFVRDDGTMIPIGSGVHP